MEATSYVDRLDGLVKAYHGGKVRRAAAAWGVPQQTLDRILKGKVRHPRGDLLLRIAALHRTTVEWVLTGSGPDPAEPVGVLGSAEYAAWSATVDSLGLPEELREEVRAIPTGTWNAWRVLCIASFEDYVHEIKLSPEVSAAMHAAGRAEYRAWRTLFESLVATFGPEEVRKKLISEAAGCRFGFSGYAGTLFDRDAATLQDLDKRWHPLYAFAATGIRTGGFSGYSSARPMPPLELTRARGAQEQGEATPTASPKPRRAPAGRRRTR